MQNFNTSNLKIDLSVIYRNLNKIAASFGHVMVMVKANAYGTDPLFISKFLQISGLKCIPFVGVSHVWEGVHLREAGITLPIFVIAAPAYEAELVAIHQLTPAVSTFEEVEQLNLAAKKHGKKLSVHLHLNTGMNRLGVSKAEAIHLYQAIKNAAYLHLEGAMTHFAAAESSTFDSFTYNQIDQFKQFLDMLPSRPRWIHAANSGAAVRFNIPFCNLVRIGLGTVGYGHCLDGVKPALSFTSILTSISFSKKGETVGYNCTYKIKKDRSRIGVIPVGYHDGFHRVISGKGYVLIRGKKAPMIGTICMDFMMIDLNEVPEAEVGDEILLFGSGLSPEIIASWAKTDIRELLAGLPLRVKRVWINPPKTCLHALSMPNPSFLLDGDGNRQSTSTLKKYYPPGFITFQGEIHPECSPLKCEERL